MSIGTHQTHCCLMHGCKYGNDTCAVVKQEVEQSYACPSCQPSASIQESIEHLEEEKAWSLKLEARGLHIEDGYY